LVVDVPQDHATQIEVVNRDFTQGGFRAAIFDFDGTLSLLRRNWEQVMIPMMIEILQATGTPEAESELRALVEQHVDRSTGRQTIYQMIWLAEQVAARHSATVEPLEYKRMYHDLLWAEVGGRVEAVRKGQVPADEMLVAGSVDLLDQLTRHGLTLYLASGTDLEFVRDEARVLGIDGFFGSHMYGALDDYKKFSKKMIVEHIVSEIGLRGEQILGFGDGYVEIEEVKKVGGLAVGVASDENRREGINRKKRERLVGAGADLIVSDFRSVASLLQMIGLA
jgi:phosphoglycolate phosphatase